MYRERERDYINIVAKLHYSRVEPGTVDKWLALSPYIKKALGLVYGWGRASLCGVCSHFVDYLLVISAFQRGFPPGASPVSPTIKNKCVRSVSSLYPWLRHWLRSGGCRGGRDVAVPSSFQHPMFKITSSSPGHCDSSCARWTSVWHILVCFQLLMVNDVGLSSRFPLCLKCSWVSNQT